MQSSFSLHNKDDKQILFVDKSLKTAIKHAKQMSMNDHSRTIEVRDDNGVVVFSTGE